MFSFGQLATKRMGFFSKEKAQLSNFLRSIFRKGREHRILFCQVIVKRVRFSRGNLASFLERGKNHGVCQSLLRESSATIAKKKERVGKADLGRFSLKEFEVLIRRYTSGATSKRLEKYLQGNAGESLGRNRAMP